MKIFSAILLTLVFSGNIFAADVSADFSMANKFYAEGKFSEAAGVYERILATGAVSPNLLFNYGNAEFKSGNLGKAIAAFRRAELLAPRDSEIHANLDFARNQVHGQSVRQSRWQDWIGSLSLDEGALLTAVLFWTMFALFALRQLKPALVPKLRTATRLVVMLTVFSGTILGLQAANHFNDRTAVVTEAGATARSGPFDEAQSAFTARDGMELSVLDHHGEWVQVADGSGKSGWLPAKQVEVLPGA